jgi:broad specificity phosphatase PhoE
MGTIYLIRHGQASFDADDYDQLSALGEQQSRLLGDWLRVTAQPPSQIALGGAKRHQQTAHQCLKQYRTKPEDFTESSWIIDRGFDEFDHQEVLLKFANDFADFASLRLSLSAQVNPRRAFQELFTAAVTRWVSGEFDDYTESWAQFQTRCRLALTKLIAAQESKQTIWVFTSGGTISALVQSVLGIPDHRLFELNANLINSGVTQLFFRHGAISLSYLNSAAHLEVHQKPELMSYR